MKPPIHYPSPSPSPADHVKASMILEKCCLSSSHVGKGQQSSSYPHREPLLPLENTVATQISVTPLSSLLSGLPTCLNSENKLPKRLDKSMPRAEIGASTGHRQSLGLLAFMDTKLPSSSSPVPQGANASRHVRMPLSNKRLQSYSDSLPCDGQQPQLKRARQDAVVGRAQCSSRSTRTHRSRTPQKKRPHGKRKEKNCQVTGGTYWIF